jgi:AcrR family transcriptional regulator
MPLVNATSRIPEVAPVKKQSAKTRTSSPRSSKRAPTSTPRLSRAEKAAQTRERMLAAAYDEFCERGFRSTTMDAVAQRAGVAVQTLYFTFHTKDALLQELLDRAVLGDDPTPPPLQDWYQAALVEPDVVEALAHIVAGSSTICGRVAPLMPVFHAVAQEPAGRVFRQGEDLRRTDFAGPLIDALRSKAPLRHGVTRQHAVDLLFVILGPETYHSFVLGSAWPPDEFVRWATQMLARDLFGVEVEAATTKPARTRPKPRAGAAAKSGGGRERGAGR